MWCTVLYKGHLDVVIILSFVQLFGCESSILCDYNLYTSQSWLREFSTDGFGLLNYEIKERFLFVQIKRGMLNIFKYLFMKSVFIVINPKQITDVHLFIKYTQTRMHTHAHTEVYLVYYWLYI